MESYIHNLPGEGYLRLSQIIGQRAVTPEEASENRRKALEARKLGERIKTGPHSPRPAIPAIVPWSKSKLWDAVRKGEFPAPVKLSSRTTAWSVQSVRKFLERKSKAI